jgi:hypothetical protein
MLAGRPSSEDSWPLPRNTPDHPVTFSGRIYFSLVLIGEIGDKYKVGTPVHFATGDVCVFLASGPASIHVLLVI